ncbi:MAG: hypothetical protein QMB37_02025 [Paludibacteraceae bacterium]
MVLPVCHFGNIVTLIIDITLKTKPLLSTGYRYLYDEPNPDIKLF